MSTNGSKSSFLLLFKDCSNSLLKIGLSYGVKLSFVNCKLETRDVLINRLMKNIKQILSNNACNFIISLPPFTYLFWM